MELELDKEEAYLIYVLCKSLLNNEFLLCTATPLQSGASAGIVADNIRRKIMPGWGK
jgi:hypothetical protein